MLNFSSTLKQLSLAAALSFGMIGAASAAAVIANQSVQGAGNQAHVFGAGYNGTTPAGASWSADPTVTPPPGSVGGINQSPFNNTPVSETQSYFSVWGPGANGGALTPVTLDFASDQSDFSMLWGSIDSYNMIEFFDGAVSVFSLTGAALSGMLVGAGGGPNYELVALVNFDFGNATFDSIVFTSETAAFEFALPSAVPEPGSLALLGLGLAGLAAASRRKQKQA